MWNDDLEGLSFADVLERLEAGKIGHKTAMDWIGVKTFDELVRTMHFNGRQMPGHRPMIVTKETRDLVISVSRPLPKPP